jgi:hypothetical protein
MRAFRPASSENENPPMVLHPASRSEALYPWLFDAHYMSCLYHNVVNSFGLTLTSAKFPPTFVSDQFLIKLFSRSYPL